jgi:hypothetical protein
MTAHTWPKVKLSVPLPADSEHGTENVWVESVADGKYRVRNIPTWAYDLSLDDVVEAHEAEDGRLMLDRVAGRGGHSTYRIIPFDGTDRKTFLSKWSLLEDEGCTYESHSSQPLYAVDVPPAADIQRVYKLLEEGEQDGVWDFEEGHCGHSLA